VIGWEDYYSCDIFRVEGFPQKDQIEELFIVTVYCIPARNIVNFLAGFTF